MTAQSVLPLPVFYAMLERHDWFWNMADDHEAWAAGKASWDHLVDIAAHSPEHGALLEAYRAHVFSGQPWGTERQPKPQCPA